MNIMLMVGWLFLSLHIIADDPRPVKAFDDYRIYYNTLPSNFIQPQVAEAYQITRSDNHGLVNISVISEKGSPYGDPAQISGQVENLLGQQQPLEFFEVRDGKALYYLAQFEYFDETPLQFTIQVSPVSATKTFVLTFEKEFYRGDGTE